MGIPVKIPTCRTLISMSKKEKLPKTNQRRNLHNLDKHVKWFKNIYKFFFNKINLKFKKTWFTPHFQTLLKTSCIIIMQQTCYDTIRIALFYQSKIWCKKEINLLLNHGFKLKNILLNHEFRLKNISIFIYI